MHKLGRRREAISAEVEFKAETAGRNCNMGCIWRTRGGGLVFSFNLITFFPFNEASRVQYAKSRGLMICVRPLKSFCQVATAEVSKVV